jgi:hypothetical protein
MKTSEGHEETLIGCPNVATHLLGYVKEIGLTAAVCEDHAPRIKD